ncbi:ATPase-like, ParA/MinD [Thermaerobacter marianensis DSM 12885]|uniref:Iron-sulfur cluster carrier protein n=1 Tax=Thermaerobacter marianensis (strain ATCC 700841 / DSM 12885 / JCM 10246 / 7p75a) TaxID=644966 RepID=E6SGG2_THEM7|nr:Mrp/NBP35 family ATP-binding protein [Thermaerobacter marianensis]ADU51614.1 ATPase-like, ParA/MinD [Thermaerobacter marianensis DSM 12885]
MNKRDVLQQVARVRLDDGSHPLADGRVQDVLVEMHGNRAHVAILVDETWDGGSPPPEVQDRLREAVLAMPGVASVRVVPRPRPKGRGVTVPGAAPPGPAAGARGGPAARLPEGLEGARFVAVASGKGGVGKSSVSVNLAVALARRGLRVAILDCDIYGFSVPALIGLERPPALDADGKVIPGHGHGVDVMSMDFFVQNNSPVAWRGPMLGKALRQFLYDTAWNHPDVVVLDLPPGTGDVALDVQQQFPPMDVLIVTTPDPFAARVAERAGSMAKKMGHRVMGVVENMAYRECSGCGRQEYLLGRGGGDAVAAALGTQVLARIPMEPPPPGLRTDGLFPPASGAGRAYEELADAVTTRMGLNRPAAAHPAGRPR